MVAAVDASIPDMLPYLYIPFDLICADKRCYVTLHRHRDAAAQPRLTYPAPGGWELVESHKRMTKDKEGIAQVVWTSFLHGSLVGNNIYGSCLSSKLLSRLDVNLVQT